MRLSGDCTGALSTFRKFIAGDATASDQHKLAEDLTRELEATCGAKQPPVADLPRSAPQPDPVGALNDRKHRSPPGRTLKIVGVATGGVGVAAIAVGIGLGIHARSLSDEVSGACQTSCDWAQWKDKDAAGHRDATVGQVLDVAGVVGIAGGAALYYLGVRQGLVTVTTMPRESGAVISWNGSW
jgi:hypothetical protein